jgi:hypothetical protein
MQAPRQNSPERHALVLGLLAFGLIGITLRQSASFHMIPGDLGDARFNNMILEHLFRWVTGHDQSLWSPEFFYPFAGALSFSDNHFGSGFVYILQRLLGASPEVAFIGWYTLAPVLNYLACYYVLRRFGTEKAGSAVGAFIFTFALPVTAQLGHAQLSYRFATPLAMLAWERLKREANPRDLAKLAFFTMWQFYCSIYLGYFLLFLIAVSLLSTYLCRRWDRDAGALPHASLASVARAIFSGNANGATLIIIASTALLAAMLYPYAHYSKLYGFQRDITVIESMLPRLGSYLIGDASLTWKGISERIQNVPTRNEQQMFFGIAAIALAIVGAVGSRHLRNKQALVALALLVLITLDVHGHSIYLLIAKLPLVNAIRAVSRISIAMLFPLAILAGSGMDWLCSRERKRPSLSRVLAFGLGGLMLVEYCAFVPVGVPLPELEGRITSLQAKLPHTLAKDAIVFVPVASAPGFFLTELDGMILSRRLDRPTLNGYSGNTPPNTGYYYALQPDCDQVNFRLSAYVHFVGADKALLDDLVKRVVMPDQSMACVANPQMLQRTHCSGDVPAEVIRGLALHVDQVIWKDGRLAANISLENRSKSLLPAISDDNKPVRFSWRFVGVNAPATTDGWDPRSDLLYDVAGGQTQQTQLSLSPPHDPGRYHLEVSMVQDRVVWFHDAGMAIAKSDQVIEVKPDGSVAVTEESPDAK